MNSVVCTLFEGNFHYGLAALTNSLCRNGFKGRIFAGYRGSLPVWAKNAKPATATGWENSVCLEISAGVTLYFLQLDVPVHFTNYKPDFMLKLLEGPAKNADTLFYFDPDIVIKCDWGFFEEWAACGVAVVHEIVSNDMPLTHPIRNKWKAVLQSLGKRVNHKLHSYINAGFCGLSSTHFQFLYNWQQIIKIGIADYNVDPGKLSGHTKTHPFSFPDQDSMNMALMCYEKEISEIGPEGMDFLSGGYIMSHATGISKPWNKPYIKDALLKGVPPTTAQKEYWKNAEGVLNLYSKQQLSIKKSAIGIASFISRFYARK